MLKKQPDGNYIVRIHLPWEKDGDLLPWEDNNVPRLIQNYPRKAIHFFVFPYETDQQMPGTFRHSIGIPDAIFPQHWKKVKEEDAPRGPSGPGEEL